MSNIAQGSIVDQATDRSAIENATVYAKHTNNNRKFEAEFYGQCEDLVRKRAKEYYEACDMYSSPSLGPCTFDGQFYYCTVTTWSMD